MVKVWAKYKPVEYSQNGHYGYALTEAQRQSVNYGLDNIPYWSAKMLGNMLNFWFGIDRTSANQPDIGDKPDYWTYLRPRTAFRMSDLIANPTDPNSLGYFTGAKPPLGNLVSSQIAVTPGGSLNIIFSKNEEGVSAGLTLRYEDLQLGGYNVYNMYFGFSMRKTGTSTFYTLTQNTTMQSFQAMGASVHTHVENENMAGTYEIFPFVSSDAIRGNQYSSDVYYPTTATNIRSNFVALMEKENMTLTITFADVKVSSLTSYVDQSHTTTIRNIYVLTNYMTDYPVTVTKIKLEYIRTDGYTVYYTQELITAINIDSGQSVSGTTDHNFSEGTSHIGYVRMTIMSLENVVFFHTADSVKIATVGTGPTPDA